MGGSWALPKGALKGSVSRPRARPRPRSSSGSPACRFRLQAGSRQEPCFGVFGSFLWRVLKPCLGPGALKCHNRLPALGALGEPVQPELASWGSGPVSSRFKLPWSPARSGVALGPRVPPSWGPFLTPVHLPGHAPRVATSALHQLPKLLWRLQAPRARVTSRLPPVRGSARPAGAPPAPRKPRTVRLLRRPARALSLCTSTGACGPRRPLTWQSGAEEPPTRSLAAPGDGGGFRAGHWGHPPSTVSVRRPFPWCWSAAPSSAWSGDHSGQGLGPELGRATSPSWPREPRAHDGGPGAVLGLGSPDGNTQIRGRQGSWRGRLAASYRHL